MGHQLKLYSPTSPNIITPIQYRRNKVFKYPNFKLILENVNLSKIMNYEHLGPTERSTRGLWQHCRRECSAVQYYKSIFSRERRQTMSLYRAIALLARTVPSSRRRSVVTPASVKHALISSDRDDFVDPRQKSGTLRSPIHPIYNVAKNTGNTNVDRTTYHCKLTTIDDQKLRKE